MLLVTLLCRVLKFFPEFVTNILSTFWTVHTIKKIYSAFPSFHYLFNPLIFACIHISSALWQEDSMSRLTLRKKLGASRKRNHSVLCHPLTSDTGKYTVTDMSCLIGHWKHWPAAPTNKIKRHGFQIVIFCETQRDYLEWFGWPKLDCGHVKHFITGVRPLLHTCLHCELIGGRPEPGASESTSHSHLTPLCPSVNMFIGYMYCL